MPESTVRRALLAAAACLALAGCNERESGPASVAVPAEEVAGNPGDHAAEVRDWRERREARLTEPYGYLSLIGLVMLEPGSETRLGSDTGNDVVLPRGPAIWGTVVLNAAGDRVEFAVADGAAVRVDGEPVAQAELVSDAAAGDDDPTLVEADRIRFHVVDRGGRLALRIRDPESPTRLGFAGIEHFPIRPEWRIEARFEPHPEGRTIEVANVLGQLIDEPNPGRVRFELDGKPVTLEALQSDDELFFIFADRTSGRETYGLGRFLYADLPMDGRVVLDFNLAYNPPCAFNSFTTCQLPPQSNRIDARVTAGELEYAGDSGLDAPRPIPGSAN